MRVLLLGDSHLARLGPTQRARLAPDVTNAAVGGSVAADLAGQLARVEVTAFDAAVLSVGTNDAAPWRHVPLAGFAGTLAAALPTLPLVYVAPPGVDEPRLQRAADRTNAVVSHYARAASAVVSAAGGIVVDTPALLAPLGAAAFVDDGLHLTPAAYDLLVPAVAAALERAVPRPR